MIDPKEQLCYGSSCMGRPDNKIMPTVLIEEWSYCHCYWKNGMNRQGCLSRATKETWMNTTNSNHRTNRSIMEYNNNPLSTYDFTAHDTAHAAAVLQRTTRARLRTTAGRLGRRPGGVGVGRRPRHRTRPAPRSGPCSATSPPPTTPRWWPSPTRWPPSDRADHGPIPAPTDSGPSVQRARQALWDVRAEVAKAVVGQDAAVAGLLIALLTRGHVLLEGVPGTAKTCSCGRWP